MLSAYVVAEYILYIAYRNGDVITNLKLQKLLYYAQAWYMVNNNATPLFNDEIQSWQFGPVVPSVYNRMKVFKYKPISLELKEKDFETMNKNQKDFIEDFCNYFLHFSATELVSMTHNETPWVDAFKKGSRTKIDVNTMYIYYKNLLNDEKSICKQ
ncbi:type II toxin-antitoxin system antitoxin SocA domain-containing protein [uncultured Treponema sp.]|uniref:Panacea domain-containing protein n=1 Tax=uncultured Treponema sp. TaxID=162155 RepID=UPI00280447CF|nr:type II toxin-antitoxin system antitoxin SocA domain-containing protein [uncultured Treponema sp.]